MDIVARAKGILLQPREEWHKIAGEPATTAGLFTGYAIPLAAISAIASFIGLAFVVGMVGPAVPEARLSIGYLLTQAIVTFVLGLIGVWVLGKIVEFLAPQFGGRADEVSAMKLAVYSYTAVWVAGILMIVPALAIIVLLATLYSFYLFYVGAPIVVGVAQDRALLFTLAVVVCAVVVNAILGWLIGIIA